MRREAPPDKITAASIKAGDQRERTCSEGTASRVSRCNLLCRAPEALRRTAISSAVMLMAISSGDRAPISTPVGAKIRANSSGA
jgi:hypothetical protein